MAGGATTLSEYESAMFMELLEENSLFVTAKSAEFVDRFYHNIVNHT